MIKKPLFLLSSVCLALSLSACSPGPSTTSTSSDSASASAQTGTESEKLAAFFTQSFQQDLEMSPMRQSRLGLKWDYGKWDDVSPAADQARRELLETRLMQSQSFDRSQLSAKDLSSLTLYQTDLERAIANDEFRLHSYIMHQFRAWHTTVPSFLINTHKVTSVEDAEAYIERLEGVKPLFEQVIEQLKLREEAGIFPPRWAYDQMIQASANVISGNPFAEEVSDSSI
jgi:uncharacterized protein (DUF885 family)